VSLPLGLRIPGKLGAEGIQRVAAWAKGVGLAALDLPAPTPEAVAALKENGLRLGSVDAVGQRDLLTRDPERQAKGRQALLERIDQTAAVGGRVLFAVLIPGEPMSRADGFRLWQEVFPPIVEYAESKGVSFALEGWPGPAPLYPCIAFTPEVFRAMFAAVPSPSLGLCYDPSHLVRLGIDYLRFLDEFGDRVRHCHGKDTEILPEGLYNYGHLPAVLTAVPGHSEGSWRYCVPGDGTVDWAKVAFRLESHGYQGPISIELEDARFHGSAEAERAGVLKAVRHLSEATA